MKRYFSITIMSLSLVALTSCDMDAPSKSAMDAQEVFSQPDLIETSVIAINQCWGETNSYRGRWIAYYGMNTDVEWYNTPTYSKRSDAKTSIANYSVSPDNDQLNVTKNPYVSLYQGIETATMAIDNIRTYGDLKNKDILHLLGEALTLRSLLYVELVKTYGDVPGRFEQTTNENVNMGRTNKDEIYKRLLSDLKEAEDYVYWPGESKYTKTVERVSKSFTKGLRARVALYAAGYSLYQDGTYHRSTDPELAPEKMYQIARDECVEVIKSGKNKLGTARGTNFEYVFQDLCGEVLDAGNESLWEIPFADGRGRVASSKGIRVEPAYNQWIAADATKNFGGECGPVPTFYYSYDKDDVRRDVTCAIYKWGAVVDGKAKQEPYALKSLCFGKYRYEWISQFGNKRIITTQDDGINWQMMRYADILLMAAEAENELNGPASAIQYMKPILDRAFPNNPEKVSALLTKYGADKDAFRNGIIDQRGFEFAGEMLRKQDLIRWGILDQKLADTKNALKKLSAQSAEYADLNAKIYYAYQSDGVTLKVYGLNHGENSDDEATIAAYLGVSGKTEYENKGWIVSSGEPTITDDIIDGLYVVDKPSLRSIWPIPRMVIDNSAGYLNNDYLNK